MPTLEDLWKETTIKEVPGVLIIGENRVDTTKQISLSGNAGDIKIETTRKTAFNPIQIASVMRKVFIKFV